MLQQTTTTLWNTRTKNGPARLMKIPFPHHATFFRRRRRSESPSIPTFVYVPRLRKQRDDDDDDLSQVSLDDSLQESSPSYGGPVACYLRVSDCQQFVVATIGNESAHLTMGKEVIAFCTDWMKHTRCRFYWADPTGTRRRKIPIHRVVELLRYTRLCQQHRLVQQSRTYDNMSTTMDFMAAFPTGM